MGCSTSRSNGENDQEDQGPTKDEFVFMTFVPPKELNKRRSRGLSGLQQKETKQQTPSLEKLLTSKNPEDLLRAFIQLDKVIMVEESRNPSSIFGHAMSRQQLIRVHLQSAVEKKNQNEILSGESPTYDLFNDVGLVRNPAIAAEHEEFLASINRRAINQKAIDILQQMLDGTDDQIKKSSARISQLQSAYHQQDELLGQIFGETYGSESEKMLEKELDTMRYFRDMLSIGLLQWELCAENTRAAANLLRQAVSSWKSIKKQALEQKISLATEARNSFQEALLLIQTAQELLQDVQFPYCTARELKGVAQTMEYMFTDILIEERYLHASEMYENFLQRAISLQEWVKELQTNAPDRLLEGLTSRIIFPLVSNVNIWDRGRLLRMRLNTPKREPKRKLIDHCCFCPKTGAKVSSIGNNSTRKRLVDDLWDVTDCFSEVLRSRLQKDLFEIEEKVSDAADKLRNERIYLICKKLRIQPPSDDFLNNHAPASLQAPALRSYREGSSNSKGPVVFDFDKFPVNLESKLGLNQEGGENNVQSYFRRVVENRKNTMWPSRRIDELQTLTLQP